MLAEKVARPDTTTFVPPVHGGLAARLQKRGSQRTAGRLSPLMAKSFGQASAVTLQAKQDQLQAQEGSSLGDALNAPGRPLPEQKRAHYESLLQTNLKHVTVHSMGAKESQIMARHGAIGLTDGQRIVANSEDTLRHELTHIQQRNEGHTPSSDAKRSALEAHANEGARSLAKGQPVQSFASGAQPAALPLQSEGSAPLQSKCPLCEEARKKSERQDERQGEWQLKVPGTDPGPKETEIRRGRGSGRRETIRDIPYEPEEDSVPGWVWGIISDAASYTTTSVAALAYCLFVETTVGRDAIFTGGVAGFSLCAAAGIKSIGEMAAEAFGLDLKDESGLGTETGQAKSPPKAAAAIILLGIGVAAVVCGLIGAIAFGAVSYPQYRKCWKNASNPLYVAGLGQEAQERIKQIEQELRQVHGDL